MSEKIENQIRSEAHSYFKEELKAIKCRVPGAHPWTPQKRVLHMTSFNLGIEFVLRRLKKLGIEPKDQPTPLTKTS